MTAAMELLGSIALLGVPLGYLALQLRLPRRWPGWWRLAAAAPLPFWLMWVELIDGTALALVPMEKGLYP
jgi:hypothetical protein